MHQIVIRDAYDTRDNYFRDNIIVNVKKVGKQIYKGRCYEQITRPNHEVLYRLITQLSSRRLKDPVPSN